MILLYVIIVFNILQLDIKQRGILALQRKGFSFANSQLQNGIHLFEKCLKNDWAEIQTMLEEDEINEAEDEEDEVDEDEVDHNENE